MASTFDRRRIQAPEISRPPVYDDEGEAGPSRSQSMDQAIYLKTGLITQANGSGYIESERVKIACSVYGPRPKAPPYSPQGSINIELKYAPFAAHPRRAPLRDTEPAALASALTQLVLPSLQLHLLPKSAIDIFLLVLESDVASNVLAAGLTVASAAIADAGIPMNALGVGSVAEDANDDPRCRVVAGVLPAFSKVTDILMTGEADVDDACNLLWQAVSESQTTHGVLAQALLSGSLDRGL